MNQVNERIKAILVLNVSNDRNLRQFSYMSLKHITAKYALLNIYHKPSELF